jgi:hypothetical protein
MPAIASLEDLKAAQKEGVSIYAMLSALCALLYGNGAGSVGKMYVEPPWERFETFKSRMVGDIPAPSEWSSLPGQAVASGTHPGRIEG